jgi:hypothetical protein
MSHALILILSGLVVAAVGVLIFYGGLKLLDRQKTTVAGIGSCLVALLGAVVIFAGVGITAAAILVR